MISKEYRFHGTKQINLVYLKGKKVNKEDFSIKFLSFNSSKKIKIAVVVSKKVNKRAVVRNKIRRRLYSSLQKQIPNIPLGIGLMLTVYNQSILDKKQTEIDETIQKIISEIKS